MAAEQKSPWVYMVAGLIIGLFVAFLVFLSQQDSHPINLKDELAKTARDTRDVRKSDRETPQGPGERQFDFYDMLPELEVSVSPDMEVEVTPRPRSEPVVAPQPQTASRSSSGPQFYLQVGAFSKYESADQQKASLLLQNWPTKVQSATKDDGRKIYRVFVGPYADGQPLQSAEKQLKQMGLKPYRYQAKS